ncbi:MAG TPA: hypothetical protein VLU46_07515 [Thermoanaerobaculia bacterium]|nr:hypothetical protein [Thermoanaerobaculia bacterium]
MKILLNIAAASGLALLMSAPAFAVQDGRYAQAQTMNARSTTQGRITMLAREGDQYRIQLDGGGYNYYVPLSLVRDRNLQVGDTVSLTGFGRANGMTVDVMAPVGAYDNSAGTVTGIVQNTNRRLNYVTVRDQATGQRFKVDVRNMDTRRSVNVWHLRTGDRIVVNGGWENRNTFNAQTVNF